MAEYTNGSEYYKRLCKRVEESHERLHNVMRGHPGFDADKPYHQEVNNHAVDMHVRAHDLHEARKQHAEAMSDWQKHRDGRAYDHHGNRRHPD
jgi:hypothetical protein